MKKIAILTINDYNNYGNRLQNYATQEVLKKQGFYVETLIHTLDIAYLKKENISLLKKISRKIKYTVLAFKHKSKIKLQNERVKRFQIFTSSNIVESKFEISETSLPKDLSDKYNYFVTGSDQIWNPYFRYCSEIDFLKFAPSEKRIALSASIGISDIPQELQEKYKELLQGFRAISVREHQGAKIVNNLISEEPEVLIDPTLNLTKDEWLEISKVHVNKPKSDYLLIYFLGEIPTIYQEFINEYAENKGLEVVVLANKEVVNYYTADPAEFIDYINDASAFFTDSYHGIIFSIIMNTPFLIFDRIDNVAKMNSRMETLQKTLKLPNEAFYSTTNNIPYIYNEDTLKEILEVEKAKVTEFIKKNIV